MLFGLLKGLLTRRKDLKVTLTPTPTRALNPTITPTINLTLTKPYPQP